MQKKMISRALVFVMILISQNSFCMQNANFEIFEGVNINLQDGLDFVGQLGRDMQNDLQSWERQRQREVTSIEDQIKNLDDDFNNKRINQTVYENRRRDLSEKIQRKNNTHSRIEDLAVKADNMILDLGGQFFKNHLDKQRDKQKLKEIAVQQEFANRGNLAIARDKMKQMLDWFKDPENVRLYLKYGLAFVGGSIGLYYATKFAYTYFERQLGLPTLVRESSIAGFSLWDLFDIFGDDEEEISIEDKLNDIILPPVLERRIRELAVTTKSAREKELPYQHVMLYGKPGTGKTMFARILAHYSGMDYAIMSGADFAQFDEGKDIEELHKLFDWAEKTEGGLLVFIDEAEAFLRKRSLSDVRTIRLLDAFLSRTGTSSKNIMFVFATNHPEMMDTAVMSRISEQVYFPLPGPAERAAILKLYIRKYIQEDRRVIKKAGQAMEAQLFMEETINDDYLASVAQKMSGIAGREIEQMVQKMRKVTYLRDDLTLTKELFEELVLQALERQRAREQFQDGVGILDTPHGQALVAQ